MRKGRFGAPGGGGGGIPEAPADGSKYARRNNAWVTVLDGTNGTNGADGEDGREVELSTSGGYVVWRYVGDVAWTNLFLIPADGADGAPGADGGDGREVELRENAGWVEWRYVGEVGWVQLYLIPTPAADTAIKVAIDFVDAGALQFVYKCPQAMKFTSQESEGADASVSPALNTNLAQYQAVTVTAPGVGLIIFNGVIL